MRRKPSLLDDGDVGQMIRGTTEVRAFPDYIGVLTPGEDSTQAIFHNVKQRWGRRQDEALKVRIQVDDTDKTASLSVEGVVTREDRSPAGRTNRVLQAIHDLGEQKESATIDAISEILGKSSRTVREYLNPMVKAGIIEAVVAPAQFGSKRLHTIYQVR